MSLAEVESLVQQLYLPGSPQDITKIQQALQQIQRSHEGWQLADALLQSRDDKVRFFGALTFSIKINKDWNSLGDDNAPVLLDRLLSWLVRLVAGGEGPLVTRKLCSTLVAYFMQPSVSWDRCIRHLLYCFYANIGVPNTLDRYPPTTELISGLSQEQLITTVWFVTSLIEEVGKTSSDSIQTHKYHERTASNMEDSVILLHHALQFKSIAGITLAQEGMKCFHSWIMYAHRAWIDGALALEPLRELMPQAILNYESDAMFEVTIELLTDVLTSFPAFYTADHYRLIAQIFWSARGGMLTSTEKFLSMLHHGDFDEEAVAFGRFLLAYGDAKVQDLATHVEDPESPSRHILNLLTSLLKCKGFAVAEDEICSLALEFWTTFIEYLIDSLFAAGEDKPPWMDEAKGYVLRSIEACWIKVQSPPHEVAVTWDSEARVGFKAFRADVEDLLQSSYTLLGVGLFQRFGQLALDALKSRNWLVLEATLFCINALSDSVADDEEADGALSKIFGSSLFVEMTIEAASIPAKAQQTAVIVLNRYTAFFERHTEYLPAALNFLFGALKSSAMANVAAKAIFAMCSSCRKTLVSELRAFMQQYEVLLTWANVDASTKEKVVGAIAAIIQAIPSDETKLDPLQQLLEYVERDVQECLRLLSLGEPEEAQPKGVCALRCLVNMGKALQMPDENIIDLDADKPNDATIWQQEPGLAIQSRIIQYLSVLVNRMRWDGDIVESACQILRAGYTETVPGPFVFPPKATEDIVLGSELNSARLGYVLDTAGVMLSRHMTESSSKIDGAALTFLTHVLQLIHAINGDPTNDPEVASSCIDLAEKLLPRYLNTFFNPQVQESIPILLNFAIQSLIATEVLPKRSAATFWSSFVQAKNQPSEVQNMLDGAIQEYGPLLSRALMRGIGGDAARSELDALAEPLKKLISNEPKAKMWLADALSGDSFPSQLVGDTEKRRWLQKVMNLRGSRGTNQAVKEFWMACRGTNLSYTS